MDSAAETAAIMLATQMCAYVLTVKTELIIPMMISGAKSGKAGRIMLEKKCETCFYENKGWDKCFSEGGDCFDDMDGEKRNWEPYTHGDAIRAMTDEELGEMIFRMTAVAKLWDFSQMKNWLESRVNEKRGFWG